MFVNQYIYIQQNAMLCLQLHIVNFIFWSMFTQSVFGASCG